MKPPRFVIVTAMLALSAIAQAQDSERSLQYSDIAIGYFSKSFGIEGVSDFRGVAAAVSWSPRPHLFFTLAREQGKAHTSPELGSIRVDASATVGTVGTWLALTDNLHIAAEVGFDYEAERVRFGDEVARDSYTVGNAVLGLRYLAASRVEMLGQLQRLQDFSGGDNSRWVYIVGASLTVAPNIDLATLVSREDSRNTYILGLRYRF